MCAAPGSRGIDGPAQSSERPWQGPSELASSAVPTLCGVRQEERQADQLRRGKTPGLRSWHARCRLVPTGPRSATRDPLRAILAPSKHEGLRGSVTPANTESQDPRHAGSVPSTPDFGAPKGAPAHGARTRAWGAPATRWPTARCSHTGSWAQGPHTPATARPLGSASIGREPPRSAASGLVVGRG